MKIELTKTQLIGIAIAVVILSILGVFIYSRAGNPNNNIDTRIENSVSQLALGLAEKDCKERNLSASACQEVKDKAGEFGKEAVARWNEGCKTQFLSDKQCDEFKEEGLIDFRKRLRDLQ